MMSSPSLAAVPAAPVLPGRGPFVALDFETATPQRDSACSVALVRVEDDRIVRAEHSLLRPPRPSGELSHIHHISEAAQKAAPTLAEVWPRLAPLLDGVDLIVAHNAAFDRSVLRASWATAGLTPPGHPWACTVEMARGIWPGLPGYKLNELAGLWGIPLQHHQALSDARACAELVLRARRWARGEVQLPWKRQIASSEVRRPVVVPTAPILDAEIEEALRLVELGRDTYRACGDLEELRRGLGGAVGRVLVGLGWTIEHLEDDLHRAARGERFETRVEHLQAILRRPYDAPPSLVDLVRRQQQEQSKMRSRWGQLTKEERDQARAQIDDLGDQIRELLGRLELADGGGR